MAARQASQIVILPAKNLRGYGTLAAEFRRVETPDGNASITRITCDSSDKALLVQAKYLSDVNLLPGVSADSLIVGEQSIPVRRAPAGGAVACHAAGRTVVILAAPTPAALGELIVRHVPGTVTPSTFQPRVAVPMYLDRWDKHGLLVYYAPWWGQPPGGWEYDWPGDLRFCRDNQLGLVVWHSALNDDTAEGMTRDTWWDWIQAGSKSLGVPLHVNLTFDWPVLWLGNRYRDETMLKAPQFVGGFYGVAHDSCGVGAISWESEQAKGTLLGVLQQTVRRFVNNPNIVGWLEPHAETSDTPQGLLLHSGPVADRSLQQYLRERFGSVRKVSDRWYGEPNHFKSWADIKAPELAEFVGFGPDAIDLRGVWRVKYVPAPDGHQYTRDEARSLGGVVIPTAPVPAEWYQPGFDDSGWDELLAPGNDREIEMIWSPLVYRRTINVPVDWRAAHPKVWLYLWVVFGRDFDSHSVYVNGQPIQPDPNLKIAYDVSAALKPGTNTLVLQPHRGIICYRAYLSPEPPAQYPSLGKYKNARWVDFREWLMWTRARQIDRGMQMIRQVDPDRPINVMAPDVNAGLIKQVGDKYGAHFHNTGYAAGFWAEYNPLLMRGSGLPSTAEAGNGAPNVPEFMAFWGRWLSEGLNGIHYFQHLGEIKWNAEILKLFETNRAMYQMVGKYHVPTAEVAVLFSTRNDALAGWPWQQDPNQFQPGGYWRMNTAAELLNYCPRDGVSEEDFTSGNVNKYRVIIDSNTSIMNETLLDKIEKWVRAGGVFVTYGQTGRHTETEFNTWPIRRITGYDVVRCADWGAGISFQRTSDQTVYQGDTWTKPTRALGVQLKKVAADCQDLLSWNDGTVAAGMRPVGRGWVVSVGPQIGGGAVESLLGPILEHFGVTNCVPVRATDPAPSLYTRHYISNAGLHDVWVMFNESRQPVTTGLEFLPGFHPGPLTDVVTGQPLAATDQITLAPLETRMWISPRADVAGSPLEWLTLQRNWWAGTVKPDPHPFPTPAQDQRVTVNLTDGWRFKPADDLTDEQMTAMTQPGVDDLTWEQRSFGIWTLPDHPTVKRAIMRRTFTVPARWTKGYIGLCVAQHTGVFVEGGRISVDGKPINSRFLHDGIYLDSANGVLKPGSSHLLAVEIKSSLSLAGPQGNAWLAYIPDPKERQDLGGEWRRYTDPLHTAGTVQLPGPFQGRYASRSAMIERRHARQTVMVYVNGPRVQGVMVNGRLLLRSGRVANSICTINITPYVEFGCENLIELVVAGDTQPNPINAVELRYYNPGEYP